MQIIDRTIDILVLLSNETSGLSVTEISKELNIPNSSAHRILQSLKKHKFIVQSYDSKKYLLGYQAITLGENFSKNDNLSLTAHPYMESLANKVDKTVALSILQQNSIITIDYVESANFMKLMVRKGVTMPALVTSAGKAILAYKNTDLIREVYENTKLEKDNNIQLNKYDVYLEELNEVTLKGYSLVDEELQPGVHGIASPIHNFNNEVIAAISITAIKENSNITHETIELLKNTAVEISKALGAQF